MDTKVERLNLNFFLLELSNKYLPNDLRPSFHTTSHFMERLLVDRSDSLDKLWVSTTFTILFRERLCEFLYILETTPTQGRISIQYQGCSIALVKGTGGAISLTTCFSGVAVNPTMVYSILSLDEQTETQHNG